MIAPFPWFGGKSRCAQEVWKAFGSVDLYIEPFAGSLASLLAREDYSTIIGREIVNDIDCYLANFWRALARDPEQVATHADYPINECDLEARHQWLKTNGCEIVERLKSDPDFFDAKIAGWWVWGMSSWIGGGWCNGNKKSIKIPHMDGDRGINRKSERSIHRPHTASYKGINRTSEPSILDYMLRLSGRLKKVMVCCGDWSRVVTNGVTSSSTAAGIFLDPPYDTDIRASTLYNSDNEHGKVSSSVKQWCIEN
jgi:DNA adenine methylase